MPRKNHSWTTLPFAPVEPLPPSQKDVWVPVDQKLLAFRLGNLASVEEVSKHQNEEHQVWRFRICAIGGATGVCAHRDEAMRRAEFLLGKGECTVQLPAIGTSKKGGAA